ncbi:hypothetical protein DEJ28_13625 [Curtobacterium sp. MCPF17_002]|uniref:hypothetical protein n=1 Tax=Curtobacterium sp. MCPF17_002 TaxID=2175645 RepID=UPI0011B43A8C|nr:hypothetical protein [Curtobacterium sp. MCPF17_002]WIB76683.1 hypothetical protein DEJ28_13625 [Curtobacterium sp. MCPF17_002]
MRGARRTVIALTVLVTALGMTGCSSTDRCNTSNSAPPHVVVIGAAAIAKHPDTTAKACWNDHCASVAGQRRAVLDLSGTTNDTVSVTVTLTDATGTWSTQHVDVDVRNLNKGRAACEGGQNRAGAILIQPTGDAENAPDRAQ